MTRRDSHERCIQALPAAVDQVLGPEVGDAERSEVLGALRRFFESWVGDPRRLAADTRPSDGRDVWLCWAHREQLWVQAEGRFVHPGLGPALRRALDRFIQEEVLPLDAVLGGQIALAPARAIRAAGRAIIDRLAARESATVRLWRRRRRVLESEWIVAGEGAAESAATGLLILGDNADALRLLSEREGGRIRCIYIDPPYNTGNDAFAYRDGLARSAWLAMMAERLKLARALLAPDGILYVSIDDKELERLKELCVELFGRQNLLNVFSVKSSDPSGHKTINPSPYSCVEYVLMIARDRGRFRYQTYFVPAPHDRSYRRYLENVDCPPAEWRTRAIGEVVAERLGHESPAAARRALSPAGFTAAVGRFAIKHASQVFQAVAISVDAGRAVREAAARSKADPDRVHTLERPRRPPIHLIAGRQILFYDRKIRATAERPEPGPVKPLTNLWTDIPWNGIAREGGVRFKNGKKPEKLIFRLFSLLGLRPGDRVLDFFAGSGTTLAVAAKMGLRWIGVEQDRAIYALALERLGRVIAGTDRSGVSSLVPAAVRGRAFQRVRLETYPQTAEARGARQGSADRPTTFSLLLGVDETGRDQVEGLGLVVRGVDRGGRVVWVVWRRLADWPSAAAADVALVAWMKSLPSRPFESLWIEGDHDLERHRPPGEAWTAGRADAELCSLLEAEA